VHVEVVTWITSSSRTTSNIDSDLTISSRHAAGALDDV
jgi:hypothetical protein